MGACQARRRPAKERLRSPTVIINLRPGHLREPGQPRPCRLPFYVPVLSTAENGAHGSIGARTEASILARPGSPQRSPPRGESPKAGAREASAAGSGAAGRRTHTRTVACTITRAHSDTFSLAREQSTREGRPGGCNWRRSALELFFPQGFQSSHALPLPPSSPPQLPSPATFLKLWVS